MTDAPTHIEVAVPLPVHATYTYGVPEDLQPLVLAGKRVLVPFGGRRVTAYVLGRTEALEDKPIKPILSVLDDLPLFPASMIPLFQWMADYYIHPLGEVIQEALPGGININDCVVVEITREGSARLQSQPTAPDDDLERAVLDALSQGSCGLPELSRRLRRPALPRLLVKMEQNGLICRRRELSRAAIRQKTQRWVCASPNCGALPSPLSETRRRILQTLQEYGEISVTALKGLIPNAAAHLRFLSDKGLITLQNQPVFRDPFGEPVERDTPPKLTLDQRHVVSRITQALGRGFEVALLAGVTGSGKTEVYLHATAEALRLGLTVLVLVPEIALICEIERRFRARFGDCVAVLHSGLSAGERLDQWIRAGSGQCRVVIGARSAIFAPLSGVGLVIVDEEHDTSYKQESRFRYNARDMAVVRARLEGAVAVLGSATPSIASVYNVRIKKFSELTLDKRVFSQPLPHIQVVDLKERKGDRGVRRFITVDLQEAIRETLSRGEQTLLFLNRRGFAGHPVCGRCGAPVKCRHCDITLTLHQAAGVYKCHLCGFCLPPASICPSCGFLGIKPLGLGTEKIEAAIRELYPDARVARMDRDTTLKKGALRDILKGLKNREIDILIGTQMVAKGHDFPGITLVGIICADLSLNFPDFRAGEVTFQVLAQVAGRAGRGDKPGRVILQTYNPDHFSITSATRQDFTAFFDEEITYRRAFSYPPFSRMIQVRISGPDLEKTKARAHLIGEAGARLQAENPDFKNHIEVMGPIEAPVTRIADQFRWQILLKSAHPGLLHRFARSLLLENVPARTSGGVRVGIDVDPFFMM